MKPSRVAVLASVLALVAAVPARAQDEVSSRQIAIAAMYPVMIHALESGNFGQARNICDQIITWEPLNPVHHYNLACIEARAGGARLPLAFESLEQAVVLGFNDVAHLQADPDLASLRNMPKYREIVEAVKRNASPGGRTRPPAGALSIPPHPPPTGGAMRADADDTEGKPEPAAFKKGRPVGLYRMTRKGPSAPVLENPVWYFAPDGTVYRGLETGFSRADLATHAGSTGQAVIERDHLVIAWEDGRKTRSPLAREERGFTWDDASFSSVIPFASAADLAGTYEGGESGPPDENRAAVGSILALRRDGTFSWSGVSFVESTGEPGRLRTSAAGGRTNGTWHVSGFSLVLTNDEGTVYRRIAFLWDETEPVKLQRFFFGGILYGRM
jgi:hypothetical protein